MNQTRRTPSEEKLGEIFKALSNPIRLQMLRYIAGYPQCITWNLVEFANLAQSTVSQHLKVLRDVDLVCGTVTGPATCYSLNLHTLQWFRAQADELAQDLARICACDDPAALGAGGHEEPMRAEPAENGSEASRLGRRSEVS